MSPYFFCKQAGRHFVKSIGWVLRGFGGFGGHFIYGVVRGFIKTLEDPPDTDSVFNKYRWLFFFFSDFVFVGQSDLDPIHAGQKSPDYQWGFDFSNQRGTCIIPDEPGILPKQRKVHKDSFKYVRLVSGFFCGGCWAGDAGAGLLSLAWLGTA